MDNHLEITILSENTTDRPDIQTEHGLAYWIRYNSSQLLFDTGQCGLIQNNAEALGINLAEAEAVILSHGHYDHSGGIPTALHNSPEDSVKIYLHPESFIERYSKKPDRVNFIGMSRRTKRWIKNRPQVFTDRPTEAMPGLHITGPIPRVNNTEDVGGAFYLDEKCTKPDGLPDDESIYIETDKGLVVLLGCAHSGVINTLEYIESISANNTIHALIGGMHLVNASDKRISFTISELAKRNIEIIAPLHCTGEKAVSQMQDTLGNHIKIMKCGDSISF